MAAESLRAPFLDSGSFVVGKTSIPLDRETNEEYYSPFLSFYDSGDDEYSSSLESEEYTSLLNELYDREFDEATFELMGEASSIVESRFQGESTDDESGDVERLLTQHFAPLARECEAMIAGLATEFDHRSTSVVSDGEIEGFLDRYEPTEELGPTFENFFGKLKKAIKKVASKAVNLAKKGVGAVATLGLGPILNKVKALVKPLLKKVLQAAIKKLPSSLQPIATSLAVKLGFQKPTEPPPAADSTAGADSTAANGPTATDNAAATTGDADSTPNDATVDPGSIQQEFHQQIANLLFAQSPVEQELEVTKALARSQAAAPDFLAELDGARSKFVDQLTRLRDGEDATPAVEQFIPAILPALKIGIRLAGRKRVVGFLASLVAKFIGHYVGPQNAPALSKSIVDAGLGLLSLESPSEDENQAAGSLIAAAVEEATRRVAALPDYILDDRELLEGYALEAVEQSLAANLPPTLSPATYRKRPELIESGRHRGVWLPMPFGRRCKRYKKYSRVLRKRLTPHMASAVDSFDAEPLGEILQEQYGLLPGEDVEAQIHLYEAVPGTFLSEVADLERDVPGLGSPDGYLQMHPLTPEAAGVLLDEPSLGREVDSGHSTSPFGMEVGQRFYFLEIPGKTPLMNHGPDGRTRRRRKTRLRLTLDFRANRIRLSLYLSEIRAQEIAVKLRRQVHAGAVVARLRHSLERGIDASLAGRSSRLKIIHESIAPRDWRIALQRLPSIVLRTLAGRLKQWTVGGLSEFLRRSSRAFIEATEAPNDGITLVVAVADPPGFAQLSKALLGGGVSPSNLRNLEGKPSVSVSVAPGHVDE